VYKAEALEHFGNNGAGLARFLGIKPSAVYQWGAFVPEKQAARLDRMTDGVLQYRPELYASSVPTQHADRSMRPRLYRKLRRSWLGQEPGG